MSFTRWVCFSAVIVQLFAGAGWCAAGADEALQSPNFVANGGFEQGEQGWMWQQWKGKPLPGYIDKDDMHEGLASFKLHQDGVDGGLYIGKVVAVNPSNRRDHVLSLTLKPQDVPQGAARVRVQIDEKRWLTHESGRADLIVTGGTHDWRTHEVGIPAGALGDAQRLTVFIYHDRASHGTLGIDSVAVSPTDRTSSETKATGGFVGPAAPARPVAPESRADTASVPGNATTPLAHLALEAINYTTGSPVVLFAEKDARVAIQVTPDRTLYRVGELPTITIHHVAAPDGAVSCRVVDGFGEVLHEASASADVAGTIDVTLPPGHGYYEVVATLISAGQTLGEARRSIGALSPPAEPVGDEPFGMYIQGDEHYPELGVRWTRVGIYWTLYEQQGDAYFESRRKLFQRYHDQHIKVIAWPKHPHPNSVSREVIEDTPESWRELEAFWTKMVQSLAGTVDAWAVVNEPIAGHWEGSDELIVRYWALMRQIVDRYDPDTPLIGPCLGLAPSNITQYENLLKLGFGKYIDAIEFHTYITSPEDMDWAGKTRQILGMTREATGKDLSIWSSEHGSSASHPSELLQAQHLMRSWLLCKKIGYEVMIWHMFSHPQGSDAREVSFGTFRNVRKPGLAPPQPRPAGLAFGVMTRQLAGAQYRTELDYLGPSINAYVFERDGKAMVALWTTSQKTYDVTLSAGDETGVTQTGLFGRVEPLEVRDGLVRVKVDRNPRLIASLPAFYLQSEPIARVDKPLEVLPGESAEATLTLVNPTDAPAEVRIEWLPTEGWELMLPQSVWSMTPRQSVAAALTASAPRGLPIGRYQLYGKVFLNGKYVTAVAAEASVLPQVALTSIEPSFKDGRAALAACFRRIDPALHEATAELAGGRSAKVAVRFDNGDEAEVMIPVHNATADRLEDLTLVVRGSQGKVQLQEILRTSFVPAVHVDRPPVIDGDLSDWPGVATSDGMSVRWRWHEQHLYLAVRASDPTHMQTQSQITQMWKDDSVQFAVAADCIEERVRESLPGLQETEEVSFDVALRSGGAAMYRHRTSNKHLAPVGEVGQDQVRYAVRHDHGVTTYEIQVPVEQVGLKPLRSGQVVRVSVLLNANEGKGRETIEWFSGIRDAKDPNLFGHLVLVGTDEP